jgi:hypothetical protein
MREEVWIAVGRLSSDAQACVTALRHKGEVVQVCDEPIIWLIRLSDVECLPGEVVYYRLHNDEVLYVESGTGYSVSNAILYRLNDSELQNAPGSVADEVDIVEQPLQ